MSKKSSESLTVVSKIDEGSFGQIFLVRKNGGMDGGKIYAMKTIRPQSYSKNREEQLKICNNELEMLKLVQRIPFFIQLKYACKILPDYHLVMDYMSAGNLFDFMCMHVLTLAEAKMCCAEIVLALQYLHMNSIVYRDLKLENILISSDGHVLLTDFGLARKLENNEKLKDRAGTVTYFAPEMLSLNRHHSYEVDFWSLGIILFELLIGHSPFLLMPHEQISNQTHCQRILKEQPCLDKLNCIHPNPKSLHDFILQLLIKDPERRLGTGQNGFEAVKRHHFFKPLIWAAVKLKAYSCLKRDLPTQAISVNFDNQHIVPLNEPLDQRQKDFHFVSSELRKNRRLIEFHGFTREDLNMMPKEIPKLKPMHDILLNNDLFIRTCSPASVIKKLIIPKKTVRFANAAPQNGPSSYGRSERSKPYDDSARRRSDRLTNRRKTRSMSISF